MSAKREAITMRLIIAALVAISACGPGWAASDTESLATPARPVSPPHGVAPLASPVQIAWCSGSFSICCKINKSRSTCVRDELACLQRGGIVVKRDAPGC
jgi:hypothetical protein